MKKIGFIHFRTVLTQPHKNMHKVFVYGTLKRNEPNYHWLTDKNNGYSKFIEEGKTKEKYPMIIATKYNIPFLLHAPGSGHNIHGEIYEVDDKMLHQLDILEEHPNYYERELDTIISKSGTEHTCWIYFLKRFRRQLLDKTMLENYSSTGSHGLVYTERCNRDPNYIPSDDVLDNK